MLHSTMCKVRALLPLRSQPIGLLNTQGETWSPSGRGLERSSVEGPCMVRGIVNLPRMATAPEGPAL